MGPAPRCDVPVVIDFDAYRPEARTGDAQMIRKKLGLREMDFARIGGG